MFSWLHFTGEKWRCRQVEPTVTQAAGGGARPWLGSTAENSPYFQGYKLGTENFKTSLCCIFHFLAAFPFSHVPDVSQSEGDTQCGHKHLQVWPGCIMRHSIVGHRYEESLFLKHGTALHVGAHVLFPDIRQPLGLLKKQKDVHVCLRSGSLSDKWSWNHSFIFRSNTLRVMTRNFNYPCWEVVNYCDRKWTVLSRIQVRVCAGASSEHRDVYVCVSTAWGTLHMTHDMQVWTCVYACVCVCRQVHIWPWNAVCAHTCMFLQTTRVCPWCKRLLILLHRFSSTW